MLEVLEEWPVLHLIFGAQMVGLYQSRTVQQEPLVLKR